MYVLFNRTVTDFICVEMYVLNFERVLSIENIFKAKKISLPLGDDD